VLGSERLYSPPTCGGQMTELGWVQEPEVEFHHTRGSGVGLPCQHPRVMVGGHPVA
jgi:hypothetical protein